MARIIHIVDGDSRMRAATSFLLCRRGYETRVYDSGAEFLDINPADGCVLLTMHMSGLSGLEVHGRMVARGMMLSVIFLGGDVPLAVRAMRQGAVDCIPMPYEPDELVQAIDRAFISADRDQATRHIKAAAVAKLNGLTSRGIQVLQGLQAGMTNAEIAHWLDLSPRTIEAHRASMMADIGATNLSQAIRIALQGGLAPIGTQDDALSLAA